MDSKHLVVFMCVWLVLNCILLDQAESFTARVTRKKGRTRRKIQGKKRDFIPSVANRKPAMASMFWVGKRNTTYTTFIF